jgi:hypothetical protein
MGEDSIDRDRLGVVTGALLLAMALARLLDVPGRAFAVNVFGSPLGVNLSETTILLLIVVGMTVTGTESIIRSHPQARRDQLPRSVMFWIVPGLLSLALAAWTSQFDDLGLWTLALLASSIVIPLALVAEYRAVNPEQRRDTWLQWSYMVLIHLVALAFFTVIYGARLRGLVSGPAILVATLLLASRLFWSLTGSGRVAMRHAVVPALILGQIAWVLNYVPLSALQGGLLLLVLFYATVGLMQQSLARPYTRGMLLEYGGVALIAVMAVLLLVP